jgi:GYD domain
MPRYILLSTLTPEGRQTMHKNPDRLEEVNKEVAAFGCKIVAQYAVLGGFDFSAPRLFQSGNMHGDCPLSLRHLERDSREVCTEPASIRGGEFPAHDLGMSSNEKVRERHVRKRFVGLGQPAIPILTVGRGADDGRCCGHIEDLDAPTAYPVGDRQWVSVSNTNLGQAHRIDGGAVTRHGANNCLPCPLTKRRVKVESVDEHVSVQKIMARGSVCEGSSTALLVAGEPCAWLSYIRFWSYVGHAPASLAG